MNFQEQFVKSFNIYEHKLTADIFSESTNSNSLNFSCKPYGLLLSFKITEFFGENNKYTRLCVRVSKISDLLDDHHRELLGQKLTSELKQPEFIKKLNEAIITEKNRVIRIANEAGKQREFDPEMVGEYFKRH